MSAVYELTNKVTFARAVVVARSEREALEMHPTNDFATWRGDGWYRYKAATSFGAAHGWVRVPQPPGWPVNLELVSAELMASRADGPMGYDGPHAYQPCEDLRQPGEGPDSSWGGRSLRDLGGTYADATAEPVGAGPLFAAPK